MEKIFFHPWHIFCVFFLEVLLFYKEDRETSARRIDPEQVRREVNAGNALLVCAYDDQEKCKKYGLINALSLHELQAQGEALAKDRKILFYCA